MNTEQTKSVGLGQAFGIILGALVGAILFIPRLVQSANKLMDMTDDVLDSGKAITTTMKESAEDFRNTSKLQADATYQQRMAEINQARTIQGLDAVDVSSARTLSPAAQAALNSLTT